MLKRGSMGQSTPLDFVNAWISGGLLLYAFGTALWIYALSKENLTDIYPYSALTFALVYVSGVLVFGESVSSRAVAGVACILVGLVLINMPGPR